MPASARDSRRRAVWRTGPHFRAGTAAVVAMLLASSMPAHGQAVRGDASALRPGARVRVTVVAAPDAYYAGEAAPSRLVRTRRLEGDLVRIGADSLALRVQGDTLAFMRSAVQSLEERVTRTRFQNIVRHGAIGLGVGAVGGAVIGFVGYEPCEPGEWFCMSRGGEAALGAVVIGASGAAAGALVGALRDTGSWRQASLTPATRVAVTVAPGGARVAIHF